MPVPQRSEDNLQESVLSSTIWVPGIELRFLGVAAGTFIFKSKQVDLFSGLFYLVVTCSEYTACLETEASLPLM